MIEWDPLWSGLIRSVPTPVWDMHVFKHVRFVWLRLLLSGTLSSDWCTFAKGRGWFVWAACWDTTSAHGPITLKRRGLCSAPTKGSLMMSSVLQLCYWLFLITADYEVLDWLIESQWLWLLIIGHFSFNLHMNQRSQCSLLLWLLIIGSVWYWSVLPVAACGFEVFWWCVQGTW